jgi:hypothetical protein
MLVTNFGTMKRLAIFATGLALLLQPTWVSAGTCVDDDDYRYYGDHWKDCSWIADHDRCERVKNGKHVGKEYCPYSCGYCNVPSPSQCDDDDDYRYYGDSEKVRPPQAETARSGNAAFPT